MGFTLGSCYSYYLVFEERSYSWDTDRPNGHLGHLEVKGFIDADWVVSPTNRWYTTGYCTFLGGNLVTLERVRIRRW